MERHEDDRSQGVLRKARSLRRLEPGASPSERSAAGNFALAERISELKANILSLHNLRHELNANEALAVRQLRAHVDREALAAGDQNRDIQQVLARYNASSDHFQNQAAMDGLRRALDQEATHALAVAARGGPQERVGRIQSHTQASVDLGVLLDALSGFAHVWHACKDANFKCSTLETALEETNRALAQAEEERDLYHDALASSSDADAVRRVRDLRARMGKIRHLSSATKSARQADASTQTQVRVLRASHSGSRAVASTQTPHSHPTDEAADERARMAEDRLHASAARICELQKTVRSLEGDLREMQKRTEQVCEPELLIVGESSSKFAQTEDFLTTSKLPTTREVAMQHSALQPVMIEAGAQTSFVQREIRSCGAQTKSMNHCHQAVQAAWLRAERGAQTMTWKEAVRESEEVGDLIASQVAELASFRDALDAKEKIEAGLRAELEQVADAEQASLARQDAQDAEALEGLRVEAKILHARIAAHAEEKELYEETIGSLRAQIRGLMSMHEKSHGLEAPTPSTSEVRELRTLAREVSEALHNRLQLHLELLCTATTTTRDADGTPGELRVPDSSWPALQVQLEAADKALQGLLERLKQVGQLYHC